MSIIKPKKLEVGDTIAIIAPSGGIKDDTDLIRAKRYFEKLGYKIKIGKNLLKNRNYLAGTDEERLEDLHEQFADKEVNAIICLRGGYGAIRLIKNIDYDLIKSNPKIFAGYSDITALSAMFLKKAGLITYSSPMIQNDFGAEVQNEFTINSFFKAVNDEEQKCFATKVYSSGNANGITFGGNLSTIVSLCGIDFIPDKKFIFFAEDIGEPVYKLDKMFTQLLNIEKFSENLSGIVFGEFTGIDNENYLSDLFNDIASCVNVPVIGGIKISHNTEKLTVPYGSKSAIHENYFIF